MTAPKSNIVLTAGTEVTEIKQQNNSSTKEAIAEQDLKITIKLFEAANKRQDERIEKLEQDLIHPKFLSDLISQYRWILSIIFCTLFGCIIWLILHCWDHYQKSMDRNFENARIIQQQEVEKQIHQLTKSYISEMKILINNNKEQQNICDQILLRLDEIENKMQNNDHYKNSST